MSATDVRRVRAGTPLAERILAWVHEDAAGCWIWEGSIDRHGYGRVSVGGRTGRKQGAHRASYIEFVGPIPGDLTVDHMCFVPRCVNPEHLRLLTASENSRNRRLFRGGPGPRAGVLPGELPTHCKHGHEYTPENTKGRRGKSGRTFRRCRACERAYEKKRIRGPR